MDVLDISDPSMPARIATLCDAREPTRWRCRAAPSLSRSRPRTRPTSGPWPSSTRRPCAWSRRVAAGALPDMVTITDDGDWALVANEGEPEGYCAGQTDPRGSVSVIDLRRGAAPGHRAHRLLHEVRRQGGRPASRRDPDLRPGSERLAGHRAGVHRRGRAQRPRLRDAAGEQRRSRSSTSSRPPVKDAPPARAQGPLGPRTRPGPLGQGRWRQDRHLAGVRDVPAGLDRVVHREGRDLPRHRQRGRRTRLGLLRRGGPGQGRLRRARPDGVPRRRRAEEGRATWAG